MTPIDECFEHPKYTQPLKEIAQWVWGKIESASNHGVSFNEETITESILLKLAEKLNGESLLIRSYTKIEEGKGTPKTGNTPTGADWSFWFEGNDGRGKELRIQAKRLFDSGIYESMHTKTGRNKKSKSQIDKLIESSRDVGAIPLYVFYNGPINGEKPKFNLPFCYKNSQIIKCLPKIITEALADKITEKLKPIADSTQTHQINIYDEAGHESSHWGCTFAMANSIRQNSKSTPIPANITMWPWHCMVCMHQQRDSKKSLPEIIVQSIKSFCDSSADVDNTALWMIRETPPKWVRSLKETEGNNKEKLDNYLQESGLRGVALFQEI